jgi:hypothetical protein
MAYQCRLAQRTISPRPQNRFGVFMHRCHSAGEARLILLRQRRTFGPLGCAVLAHRRLATDWVCLGMSSPTIHDFSVGNETSGQGSVSCLWAGLA